MAALLTSLELTNSTDARFRAWCQAIHDQMIAGGWVQTTDTGQINLATVSAPAAAFLIMGYEVFRSNDAVGSLNEIYVIFGYGSGSASKDHPYLYIYVSLNPTTGATSFANSVPRLLFGVTTQTDGANGLVTCALSAGSGWFAMAMGSTDTKGLFFSLERTLSASYQFQNEVALFCCSSTTNYVQLVSPTQVYPQTAGQVSQILPLTATYHMFNQTASLGYYVGYKGYITNPLINQIGFKSGLFGANWGQVQVESYGNLHNYLILPAGFNPYKYNNDGTFGTMVRFE